MTVVPQSGDLVFCHSSGVIGKAIRVGEWIRFRHGDQYNHVGMLWKPVTVGNEHDGWTVTDDWYVIEALGAGVAVGKLSAISPGGFHTVVTAPPGVDRGKALQFMRAQLGKRYGWPTIASEVVTILGPDWLNIMAPDTWICSAVCAEAYRYAGWYHAWPDIYQVIPSSLWSAIDHASYIAHIAR